MVTISQALQEAIKAVGPTAWYSILHERRFYWTLAACQQWLRGQAILEIGSWPGYMTLALRNLRYRVTALDLKPDRLQAEGLADQSIVAFDLNQGSQLPFPSASFDGILLGEVLEHLDPSKLDHILTECRRVLHPGGALIVTTPNRQRFGTFWHRPQQLLRHEGHGHWQEYTRGELRDLLVTTGLEVLNVQSINFYNLVGRQAVDTYFSPLRALWHYPNRWRNFLKLLAQPILWLPPLRDSVAVIARKTED